MMGGRGDWLAYKFPVMGLLRFSSVFTVNILLNLGVERNKQSNQGNSRSKTVTQPMAWGRASGTVKSV